MNTTNGNDGSCVFKWEFIRSNVVTHIHGWGAGNDDIPLFQFQINHSFIITLCKITLILNIFLKYRLWFPILLCLIYLGCADDILLLSWCIRQPHTAYNGEETRESVHRSMHRCMSLLPLDAFFKITVHCNDVVFWLYLCWYIFAHTRSVIASYHLIKYIILDILHIIVLHPKRPRVG